VVLFPCSNPNCVHAVRRLRDYRSILGERWDHSFTNNLAVTVRRLYRLRYNARPPRAKLDKGPSVSCYPCGMIEQAYLDLRARGVPLMKPLGPIGRARQRRSANEGDQEVDDGERLR
jgi:hypothetical protein